MVKQKQDDQLEHPYSSYVRILDVALKLFFMVGSIMVVGGLAHGTLHLALLGGATEYTDYAEG